MTRSVAPPLHRVVADALVAASLLDDVFPTGQNQRLDHNNNTTTKPEKSAR